MKKILLTALIAISLISSAFAAEKTKVNVVIRNNFNAEFTHAKDVEWLNNGNYVTATFISDDKKMQAFYEMNGTLIGTSQAISLDNLPARAKRAFAKKYSNYTVKEAIRFDKTDETAYFLSAENEGKSVVLKVVEGQVSVFK